MVLCYFTSEYSSKWSLAVTPSDILDCVAYPTSKFRIFPPIDNKGDPETAQSKKEQKDAHDPIEKPSFISHIAVRGVMTERAVLSVRIEQIG